MFLQISNEEGSDSLYTVSSAKLRNRFSLNLFSSNNNRLARLAQFKEKATKKPTLRIGYFCHSFNERSQTHLLESEDCQYRYSKNSTAKASSIIRF